MAAQSVTGRRRPAAPAGGRRRGPSAQGQQRPRRRPAAAAARAGRRARRPRGGRPRTARSSPARRPARAATPIPATIAGLGQHRALDLGRGRAEQPQPAAAPARRPATTAANALTTMTAAKTAIIPMTTLLSRLMVSPSAVAAPPMRAVVDADQHQHADGAGGQHDHRREHAAEQLRAAARCCTPRASRPRRCGRPPARTSAGEPAQQHGARARPGRRRPGSSSSRWCSSRRTGRPAWAVTVIVTTAMATP